jgi:hypothetical protein
MELRLAVIHLVLITMSQEYDLLVSQVGIIPIRIGLLHTSNPRLGLLAVICNILIL